jgi:hypothetical protein
METSTLLAVTFSESPAERAIGGDLLIAVRQLEIPHVDGVVAD